MDRKWNVFSSFIYQYLIVLTIRKSLSSSASIFQGQKFVCIHLYCLQTELFSLFFFTDDAVFLALSVEVALEPQWTDFISMLDRNKILSDQKL